jgi:hypothetical protein
MMSTTIPGAARTVDISDLVRLRKHLSWSAQAVGYLSFVYLFAPLAATGVELRDWVLIAVTGVLAALTTIALVKARVAVIPPLSIGLLAALTLLVLRFVTSTTIDTDPEIGVLVAGILSVAVSLYVVWVAFSGFFRTARRSPYLNLVFASKRSLGMNYAGGALSWREWVRQLRPWAVVVAIFTWIFSFVAMLAVKKFSGQRGSGLQRQVRNATFGVGGALFVWTKRKSALRGTAKRQIDRRPPVLLLRSFDDDMMVIRRGARGSNATDLHRKGMTFERVIEDHLSPFGPFIAIGRPNETLSPLGAARDYVPDDVWQHEVQQRMQDASIIVVTIGISHGLGWELSRIRALGQLHKLILLFPPADDLATRWQTLMTRDAMLGSVLPPVVRPDRTLALIYADDLTPIIIEAKRDEWSYETALRLGGMLAISTGLEPAVAH